jgi:predicted site-specific integrase-resolvase
MEALSINPSAALTKVEAALLVKVSTQTIDRWEKAGKIKRLNTPGKGVRYSKEELIKVQA